MKNSCLKLGTLLFPFIALQASSEYTLNESNPIPITFSHTSHNRISIENGSIEKLFGDDTLFSIKLDHVTGQAFVSLLKEISETPSTITVVTSSGYVQDIHILSDQIPSEHIFLKEPQTQHDDPMAAINFHANTIQLLNDIIEGNVPFGYGKRDLQEEDVIDLPKPLEAVSVRAYDGPFETIVMYHIYNRGRKSIVISANSLKKHEQSWVFMNGNEIRSRSHVVCIIATPKAGDKP
ncbi:MAG: type-F conjugative transfer system secretin TraK [Simkaniaceae bacterium]|nr:type-F conjugative transfer system secretin TraK [Simkaniaceae bacterium]